MTTQETTDSIKQYALHELGFSACGIAKAHTVSDHKQDFLEILKKGYHGDMKYLENHFEKRFNPQLLVENTKSVVVVLLNYYPKALQSPNQPQVAKYAYGKDYHKVMKKKLKQLLSFIQTQIPSAQGRFFSDSAPVLEHYWAQQSGLGWIGKNGLLINKTLGSYVFIGELFLNLDLVYDTPTTTNHCGTCTKCIDACPTNALVAPHKMIAEKCISYLTIEKKLSEELPLPSTHGWIFGCDICQDVCPWNQQPIPTITPEFSANPFILSATYDDWETLSETEFDSLFQGSPIRRAGYEKIKENLKATKVH